LLKIKHVGLRILMVVAIGISFLLASSSLKTSIPFDRSIQNVQKVYHQIAVHSGEQDVPDLIVLHSGIVNAWTDGQTIFITTAILDIMKNDNELAMVVAHELAHAINHDVYHSDLASVLVEAHADKLGGFLMLRAGYDVCTGKEIFRTFSKLYGDTTLPSDHPSNAYRLDQLDMPWCTPEI
jgi:Zn-dependent protease with chaperone function